ncbi:hypothetical protein RB628_36935 [Streptomyces sp. ADMS]|uniref:hypothetical protein n=1 Tax=Streptomyces sp. ADMS TaxID=3071415 RepID=UPI00296FE2CC|nr:hypothetical protein [Streptomyces sp. ADMS]MDW4910762.1 hypothetical protein [Streptomyces sp. ADMS]
MHRLDSYSGGRRTPATGVRRRRGAAARAQHVRTEHQTLTRTKPINPAITIDPPLRRLPCPTSPAAHQTHAARAPQAADTARTP